MEESEYLKLYTKLSEIEARVIVVETNMCWIKKLVYWIAAGVAASLGIQLPEFI